MNQTTCVIVNTAAGGGRCGVRSQGALSILREAGWQLDVRETTSPGHATEIARQALDEGLRRFLAVGGDGTSYEVVNGLFPTCLDCDPVTLGILPLGTGNSLVRDFGITTEEQALSVLMTDQTRPCDVVRVCHRSGEIFYLNLLSLGFSARAGNLTNRRFKGMGAGGYIMAVLIELIRLKHPVFPVRLDGAAQVDRRACALLSFCNSRFTAGTMMMAPTADISDGRVDVIRVGALSRLDFLQTFPKIFRGTHPRHPKVEAVTAARVTLELEEAVDVMVDGEVLSLHLESLEVLPSALQVIA